VQSNLVLVDVVVTKNGVPVKGLTEDEFRVLENGKQQELKVFEAHSEAEQPATASNAPAPKALALLPNTYSDFSPTPPSSAINVLLLDALNTQSTDQANVRKQMLAYLKKIPTGTRMAILTLSSQLRMIQGFTADASLLARAISDKGAAVSMADTERISDASHSEVVYDLILAGQFDAAMDVQQAKIDAKSASTDEREKITLAALRQIAHYLSAIPGRKNLIWFSGSFPLYIDPGQNPNNPSPDHTKPVRDYTEDVRETDRLLAAARIAVYPVNAQGLLSAQSAFDASVAAGATLAAAQMDPSPTRRPLHLAEMPQNGSQDAHVADQSLQQIAADTGGKAFVNTNGFEDAIKQALADGANYYTIGYMPQVKDDGGFRRIKVNVNGGYQLAYRDGYYAGNPESAANSSASAMKEAIQFGAPPPSDIPFKVRVISSSDPVAKGFTPSAGPAGADAKALKPPVTRYLIDYMVDAHHFTFQRTSDGVAHARLEFTVLAYDADGKIINVTERAFGLDLPPEVYAQVMSGGFPEHQEIDLPGGQVFLRIVVHDLGSARAGATEIPLTVAKN